MFRNDLNFDDPDFNVIVEIVPPKGSNIEHLLSRLNVLKSSPIDAFNIATNPLAQPRMDALASSFLIQKYIRKPAILHCSPRDQNIAGIQGTLWGAKALNIKTVIAMTGDLVSLNNNKPIKVVQEIDVFSLITIARKSDLYVGSVLGNINNNRSTIKHFRKKIEAGSQFVVTQPIYSFEEIETLKNITAGSKIPIIIGIMPLQNIRHAKFISTKLKGVFVSDKVLRRISCAKCQFDEGIAIASEMFCLAREYFDGVCIMPPLSQFDAVLKIFEKIAFSEDYKSL